VKPCYDNRFVTCGEICTEKLCKNGSKLNMCDVSDSKLFLSSTSSWSVSIVIANRGCQATINVEKLVGTAPKLLAFYVKAGPNLVDITCVDKCASKLLRKKRHLFLKLLQAILHMTKVGNFNILA
jgi:hypothetical protein